MVASMIMTLHDMEHHIQTIFGDSKAVASRATWQLPIAGIGQGNGAGPHICMVVSSPLLDIMRKDGFYAHMIGAILHLEKKLVGFAFVDDTDLCVYGQHITSNNVRQSMQQSVDNWAGLLQATGGALVPNKCFWYLLDFQWKHGQWRYLTTQQHPGELKVSDEHQNCIQIPRLETHEACRTLGVRLAPDRNWATELNYLLLVSLDWKIRMAAARSSPTDAIFSLKHVILRKLMYPLTTTTFTHQQCKQIMTPLLQEGLAQM